MTFDVIRLASDGLSREVWAFHVADDNGEPRIHLAKFAHETRPTRRHGWQSEAANCWVDYLPRSQRPFRADMPRERVPLPDDVRRDAITHVIASIRVYVGHWNRVESVRWPAPHDGNAT